MKEQTHDVSHLLRFAEAYPKARPQDWLKRLYQSFFGGGHMIADAQKSLNFLQEELAGLSDAQRERPYTEPFCGDFCCVNLSVCREASPDLLNRLFVTSSKEAPQDAAERFEEQMHKLQALCADRADLFAFSKDELETEIKAFYAADMPLLRHSEAYREAYAPAYRVLRREFADYLPLYLAIERCLQEQGRVNIAIDGDSAAGKTGLAKWIAKVYDCNVFHADDYFLPQELRTEERLSEPGGNMHRERFASEICMPVREGRAFSYRPFDCTTMALDAPISVQPKTINVFEGSYTMHPELRDFYDLTVFLSVDPKEQEARILKRNGAGMLPDFTERWIPMEKRYHKAMQVKEACDFIF